MKGLVELGESVANGMRKSEGGEPTGKAQSKTRRPPISDRPEDAKPL